MLATIFLKALIVPLIAVAVSAFVYAVYLSLRWACGKHGAVLITVILLWLYAFGLFMLRVRGLNNVL